MIEFKVEWSKVIFYWISSTEHTHTHTHTRRNTFLLFRPPNDLGKNVEGKLRFYDAIKLLLSSGHDLALQSTCLRTPCALYPPVRLVIAGHCPVYLSPNRWQCSRATTVLTMGAIYYAHLPTSAPAQTSQYIRLAACISGATFPYESRVLQSVAANLP